MTYVMQESTEGLWINRLEELWIQVDDRKLTIHETTKILFTKVADKVSRTFNRVYGTKLISIRTVGVSGSLSFASLFLTLGLGLGILIFFILAYSATVDQKLLHAIPILVIVVIAFVLAGAFCLILAMLTIFFKPAIWPILSCLPTVFWLLGTYRLFHVHFKYGNQLGISATLLISIASDILLLGLVRQSLRWIMMRTSLQRIITALVIQVVTLFLIFYIPFKVPIQWQPGLPRKNLGQDLFILALFNIPTAIASIAFVFSLVIVALHRLTWPLLSQWTYVLTRNDVLEKRKKIRAIGFLCLAYAFAGSPKTWLQIAEKFL
jgi:hypothetical protein